MKKKFTHTEIDCFFSNMKEQPPIYTDEKVHQIINSPTAKARLKGNKNTNNLLKLIIMTTIFASILCTVWLWPAQTGKDLNTTAERIENEKTKTENSFIKKEDANVEQPISNVLETSTKVDKNENAKQANEIESQKQEVTNTFIAEKEKPLADQAETMGLDTIRPTDGNRFIISPSKEELEALGFQVQDSSIIYCNDHNGTCSSFSFRMHEDGSTTSGYLRISKPLPNMIISHNDFYPVLETDKLYSRFHGNHTLSKNFINANDTLLPIKVSTSILINNHWKKELIFWFIGTDNLYRVLSKHSSTINEFKRYKEAKKYNHSNLILYVPLMDSLKIIHLTPNELEKLGFSFLADTTRFEPKLKDGVLNFSKTKRGRYIHGPYNCDISKQGEDACLPIMITHMSGVPIQFIFNGYKYERERDDVKNAYLTVPVLVKASESMFEEDVLFWFSTNKGLFEALPERISKNLQKEFNYIIAEDKSALEKPECVYFEECKNTLPITKFKAFPNPANDRITVSFTSPAAIAGRISLVDLAGREMHVLQPQTQFSAGSQQFELNIESAPEGIYLLVLYSESGVHSQRIIVVR